MLKKRFAQFLIGSFLVKLVIALTLPIFADEAYYWFWGKNLQLSYFDHPPLVGWLSSLTSFIPYIPEWASLRIIFAILSTLTFYIWLKSFSDYRVNKNDSADVKNFTLFGFLFLLNPLLGLGGILVTPDSALMLFWGLSVLTLNRLLISPTALNFTLLGASLGLGFCAKYHIVFFPLFTGIALLFAGKLKPLLNKKILLTFFAGLFFSLPVLIWNYQNDFASFRFQLSHGLNAEKDYQFWWTSTYLIGQWLIFSPLLFFSLFNDLKTFKNRTYNMGAIGQWIFFLYSSFKAKVEANWPITAHGTALLDVNFNKNKLIRISIYYFLCIWLALPIFIFSSYGQEKLVKLPTSLTAKELYSEIKSYEPLYGPTYQLSSLITLMTDKSVPKLNGLSRYDFYDSLEASEPKQNRFYVLKYSNSEWPDKYKELTIELIKTFPKYNLEMYELRRE